MASKVVHQVNMKGSLDLDQMEITEVTKDAEYTYDFLSILKRFHDKQVSITIKEEDELEVKE